MRPGKRLRKHEAEITRACATHPQLSVAELALWCREPHNRISGLVSSMVREGLLIEVRDETGKRVERPTGYGTGSSYVVKVPW